MATDPASVSAWEHYRLERQPPSSGRVLLSHALFTHAALSWGMSGNDIADAFLPHGDPCDRERLASAVRLFEVPLQTRLFPSWARPFGGGAAVDLEPWHWEIDDFAPRFATSAMNLERPFDAAAEPTHWIFVADEVVDALFDLHREAVGMPRPPADASPAMRAPPVGPAATDAPEGYEALLRLPEVERLVGMKKSTIYARIEQGRFPAPLRNGARISSWRREDVLDWIKDPR